MDRSINIGTFARCTIWLLVVLFIGLTIHQNMSFGGEIEDLKRKLKYLETREMLESELELLQAEIKNKTLQIKKLESEYQDVIATSQKEQTVSTETKTTAPSNEPEKTESSVSAPVDVNRKWTVSSLRAGGDCAGYRIMNNKSIKVNQDGTTEWIAHNGSWKGVYKANLQESTGEGKGSGVNENMVDFSSEQVDGTWKIKYRMKWPGGSCKISFVFK